MTEPVIGVSVDLEGPFFQKDPGKTILGNVRALMGAMADWSDAKVSTEIAAHASEMPFYTGWTVAHTVGRTVGNQPWSTWMRVSTAGDVRTQAAAATIERRWHPYRSARRAVYHARPLITADLTKGLE